MRAKRIVYTIWFAVVLSLLLTLQYFRRDETPAIKDNQLVSDWYDLKDSRSSLLSGIERQNLEFGEFSNYPKKSLANTSLENRSAAAGGRYNVYIPYVSVPGINCAALFNGNIPEIARARIRQVMRPKLTISDDVYISAAADCTQYVTRRRFTMRPLSDEEATFPLAYSIVMFRDVELFERLLRAIYRPQNVYCVHVDKKSALSVRRAVTALVSCFSNVFVAPRNVDVRWGKYTVLEAELICMEALLSYSRKWRYFINLTGQEFPLKTNWDIVRILKVLNGANNMEGTVKRMNSDRFDDVSPLPVDVRLTKGSVHVVASRAFVDYAIRNETAVKFRDWCEGLLFPDETYFSSLNHSPNLGVPGAYLGQPETDTYKNRFIARFKNWGDGPFNWQCRGKRVRRVCIFGIGDLPQLSSRPELFANKFHLDFEPTALDCLEQLHYNRTHAEAVGRAAFDVSFYRELSYVKQHQ